MLGVKEVLIAKTLEERLIDNLTLWDSVRYSDLDSRIRAARLLGANYRGLGRWSEAETLFSQMRNECESAARPVDANEFSLWISNLHYHMGDYTTAIDLIRKVIEREKNLGNEWQAADIAAYYLAKPLFMTDQMEEHEETVRFTLKAFEDYRPPTFAQRVPFFLCELSNNYCETGRATDAEDLARHQVAEFRQLSVKAGIPLALMTLGKAAVLTGSLDAASEALTEALTTYQSWGKEGFVCDCLVALSQVALARGDFQGAEHYAGQGVAEARLGPRINEGLADTSHLNNALVQAYRVARRHGHQREAEVLRAEAYDLAAKHNRKLILRHLYEVNTE